MTKNTGLFFIFHEVGEVDKIKGELTIVILKVCFQPSL